MNSPLSFDNTAIAFANKSDKELRQAHWLFGIMGKPWLVQLGTRLAPWSIRAGLPVKGIIRKTIFRQFVGGETLAETAGVAARLAASSVKVILDYGVEGKEGEESFELACQEFIRVIDYAATQPNIPYMSIKVTGFARFALLERLDTLMAGADAPSLVKRYEAALTGLTEAEASEWRRVTERMERICAAAVRNGTGVLVDAEETWIQDPVDALTMIMMDRYNRGRVLLFNTIQLYRHDRLEFLRKSVEAAAGRGFFLGAKLVRGAYMEKERKRAAEKGYPSPIQPDKESTDRDYDAAVRLCMEQLDTVSVIIASHNESSNALGVQLLRDKGLPADHPHVHFSQLFGMSDNITYNLAGAGCSVSKYLPFGPIGDVVPYLMRRAQENTSVGGQTGRELMLLQKEMQRRGM
ncbi:MAG: proline dehydrogenase [Chitinophagaceae bacterium]|nr:MAG: proline dehydrogenase [Chitinophagaceae bacterium]